MLPVRLIIDGSDPGINSRRICKNLEEQINEAISCTPLACHRSGNPGRKTPLLRAHISDETATMTFCSAEAWTQASTACSSMAQISMALVGRLRSRRGESCYQRRDHIAARDDWTDWSRTRTKDLVAWSPSKSMRSWRYSVLLYVSSCLSLSLFRLSPPFPFSFSPRHSFSSLLSWSHTH
jgi:hypothetical protein